MTLKPASSLTSISVPPSAPSFVAVAGRRGLYFSGMQESRADSQAYDEDARRRLRTLRFDLVGLADPLAAD